MAKKDYFENTFREEQKRDLKKEIERKRKKFYCDHKIEVKGEEESWLKIVSAEEAPDNLPFDTSHGVFKCTKCKRYIPIEPQSVGTIRDNIKYVTAITDAIKAAIPGISDDRLEQFATFQLFLDTLPEMYQVHILNNNRHYEVEESDGYVDGETLHINTGGGRGTYEFDDGKSYKHKNKNKNKNKNKQKNKNGKKHKSSSITDMMRY